MTEPWREMGLRDDEYRRICDILGREPNYTELGMFAVLWSEHCAYKHSRPLLKRLPTGGPHVVQGPGENAGAADIGDGMVVCWKVESHNHPSAIEPYQGAATGIGGIVRDILAMGARPVALLDSLRFGELESDPRSRYLFSGVVAGISGYGNCIGVPTVGGEVAFAPEYRDNPLVNVLCVGLARRDELMRAVARGPGNSLLLVGNRTGRDGIHGCTFASEELGEKSEERRPAVQVGDPFTKKLLIEACLEALQAGGVVGLQDLGAAGLTSSLAETATRGGVGIRIDVGRVPRREPDMTPYEVMISESQERMLFIVERGQEHRLEEVFSRWGLESTVIGEVTDSGRLVVYDKDVLAADVPVRALTEDAPTYELTAERPEWIDELWSESAPLPPSKTGNELLLSLLAAPNVADKRWVWEQYDHMVQLNTVRVPGADAAVIRLKGTSRGLAVSTDGNGRLCWLDPVRGGRLCVAEAGRNVVCMGGRPIGITNCLNFGNPEKPVVYWQLESVISGMSEACSKLDMPVTGGNVSLYNETGGTAVYPTPVIGAVGLVDEIRNCPGTGFCSHGDRVLLLGPDEVGFGGSEYLNRVYGRVAGRPLDVDLTMERLLWQVLLDWINSGRVRSAHDCSEGGLAVAVAECVIAGQIGADLDLGATSRWDLDLFGEGPSRVVVTVSAEHAAGLLSDCRQRGLPARELGSVGGSQLVIRGGQELLVDLPGDELSAAHRHALPNLLGEGGHGQ